jgi:K+-transporting ATPase KdpF subunit
MARLLHPRFWLPLLLAVGGIVLAPLFRGSQPPLQSHALALLLSGTLALAGYLFAVIVRPEKF